MYTILQSRWQGMQSEVTAFAQALVRTESPSLHEEQAADLTEKQMRALGLSNVQRDDFGNVISLMLGRQADPTLVLISHLDTMPSAKKENDDRFSGRLADGKLYGAGASDCKGGLAAQLYAAALLKRSLLPLRGNLIVAATVAEENGLSIGVRGLMEHTLPELGLKPNSVILGEPTGLGLYYGHDGWMELDIQVEGPNPFHVEDVARHIAADLGNVMGKPPRAEEAYAMTPITQRTASGVCSAGLRFSRRLQVPEEEAGILSQVEHGARQIARHTNAVGVAVQVRQVTQQLYNGKTTVARRVVRAWNTDPFDPLSERARQALAAAGSESRPGKWQLGQLGMGTAGSVLVNEFNIPTIGYGPGLETQAHAADEYVELQKLHTAVYGTAAIAHSLVGIPVCGWTSDEI